MSQLAPVLHKIASLLVFDTTYNGSLTSLLFETVPSTVMPHNNYAGQWFRQGKIKLFREGRSTQHHPAGAAFLQRLRINDYCNRNSCEKLRF